MNVRIQSNEVYRKVRDTVLMHRKTEHIDYYLPASNAL